jgi:hypothetical protein
MKTASGSGMSPTHEPPAHHRGSGQGQHRIAPR